MQALQSAAQVSSTSQKNTAVVVLASQTAAVVAWHVLSLPSASMLHGSTVKPVQPEQSAWQVEASADAPAGHHTVHSHVLPLLGAMVKPVQPVQSAWQVAPCAAAACGQYLVFVVWVAQKAAGGPSQVTPTTSTAFAPVDAHDATGVPLHA